MRIARNRLEGLYRAGIAILGKYPLHEHEFGELFWIDKGSCLHTVNGKRQTLNEGDFVLIRPPDVHCFDTPRGTTCQLNNVAFHWDTYQYLRRRYLRSDTSIYGENLKYPKTIHLTEWQLQLFRKSFPSLFREKQDLLQLERFLLNVFGEIFPGLAEAPTSLPTHLLPPWLENACLEIRVPERLRLGLPEFYRLCHRCPAHVSREFRRILGETPHQYLYRLRMEHAALMLSGTTREIVDISLDCGFESLSYFYSCFRKQYGVSPGKYRRQRQPLMNAESPGE